MLNTWFNTAFIEYASIWKISNFTANRDHSSKKTRMVTTPPDILVGIQSLIHPDMNEL